MKTMQEMFDTVLAHARRQQARSVINGQCAYRGKNGLMYFVGCLIPNELYQPVMEGRSCRSQFIVTVLYGLGYDDNFCRELQLIHDTFLPPDWEYHFRQTATTYGLEYKHAVESASPV